MSFFSRLRKALDFRSSSADKAQKDAEKAAQEAAERAKKADD
ncbi:MAG: hypothetical protein V9G19_27320 [Tetrasphaera sp.]